MLTELFGFNRGVVGVTNDLDIEMVTPAFPGKLIDVIPFVLINPIDGSEIEFDVAGNARVDANGDRDIGALQLGLAPFLAKWFRRWICGVELERAPSPRWLYDN